MRSIYLGTDFLKQPEDGRLWGTKIGSCTGTSYDATLLAKKINSAKCNNKSAWR